MTWPSRLNLGQQTLTGKFFLVTTKGKRIGSPVCWAWPINCWARGFRERRTSLRATNCLTGCHGQCSVGGADVRCSPARRAVDAPPDLHVERPEERLRHRPRTGTVRRPLTTERGDGHAARNESSISGTGTTSRTEATIESAPTSAASAS